MRKLYGLAIAVLLLAPAVMAQEHYTEGPVWRVELVRVKPTHMDEYLASLQKSSKPLLDEEKKEGLILDYKFFIKETKNDPQDWDVCLAIQYKNRSHGWPRRERRRGSRQDPGRTAAGPAAR